MDVDFCDHFEKETLTNKAITQDRFTYLGYIGGGGGGRGREREHCQIAEELQY